MIGVMIRSNLARAVVVLRRRQRWRQSDLAERAGVSRHVVSRIERGLLGGVSLRTIGRLIDALDASASLVVRWHGEELDRLVDATHAGVVEATVALLGSAGWITRVEVSFNHYGDRGRVDILAYHPALRILLVIEVKSAIGDLQDTLGRLDVKWRLGPSLARSVGWDEPAAVLRVLVIADTRTARRVVERHRATLDAFPLRGRDATRWVRRPSLPAPSPGGLLWFANVSDARPARVTRGGRVRR